MLLYKSLEQQLLKLIEPSDLLNNLTKLAIAVSGGSDSLALCILCKSFSDHYNINIVAVTIDHGLRVESAEEAKYVTKILKKYNIEHVILSWEGKKPISNIQEEARNARYKLLTSFCKSQKIKYLLTAHQKNDQAENFLIRANRGSGISGLAGISKKIIINDIIILRPLLNLLKSDLQFFLKNQQIKWIEDPSNYNDRFTRVKHRKFLEANTELIELFASISENLKSVKDAIDATVDQNMKKLVKFTSENEAILNLDDYNSLPQEIRFRMLEKIIQKISNSLKPARGERIARLVDKLEKGKEFSASTLSSCLVKRKKNLIHIRQEFSKP